MAQPVSEGWITTQEAEARTGYSQAYLRRLAKQGKILARKFGRDWLFDRASLQAYKQQMDALGDQRHNPWRDDLTTQGRGRSRQVDLEEVE